MEVWTDFINIIVTAFVPIAAAWIASVEWRLRKMQNLPTREEVDETIELHQRDLRVMQQELKEDMLRVENKLDKIIDKLV